MPSDVNMFHRQVSISMLAYFAFFVPIFTVNTSVWVLTSFLYSLLLELNSRSCPELFHIQMRISFPFLLAKDLRRFLLIMRNRIFLTLLYIGGTYARLMYTWYKNISPHYCNTDSLS